MGVVDLNQLLAGYMAYNLLVPRQSLTQTQMLTYHKITTDPLVGVMFVHIDLNYQITLPVVPSACQADLLSIPARRDLDSDITGFRDSPTPLTDWATKSV